MTKLGGQFEIWRYVILLGMGLGTGLFLMDSFRDVSADKELTVFGLSALISGCVVIWLGSFVIPAGYDPAKVNTQTRLVHLTAMFLPVMALVIALYFLRAGLAMAPALAPFAGIAGYFAGCKITERS